MKLKLAQMWDHNGTNMEAIGFMYRTYKVLIALDENQDMTGHPLLSDLSSRTRILSLPDLGRSMLRGTVLISAPVFTMTDDPLKFEMLCSIDMNASAHP